MNTDWIFGWWNLVYLAPFALALIYLGVYAASGVTFGDADADTDADVDADADTDADADHDVEADHDADAGGGTTPSLLSALTWLGVGRVPLSIVMMVLLMIWGAIGFAMNVLARESFGHPWPLLALSLPAALAGSLAVTSAVSKLIVRYLPLHETFARRRHELLGSVGEAVFDIRDDGGMVMIRDEFGHLFQVACRVHPGDPTIPKGARVQLVSFDATNNVFFGKTTDPATAPAGSSHPPPATATKAGSTNVRVS